MNTKLVNSAAGVINAALTQNRTAAGIALALDSAQLLLTPETAAELERLREYAQSQQSREEELLAAMGQYDLVSSPDAWALGMMVVSHLDGPHRPCAPAELEPGLRALVHQLRARAAQLEEAAVEGRAALASFCYDHPDPGSAALGALYLLQQATIGTPMQPGESVPLVFRASHDSIVMGLYTTRAAARAHCEANVRREEPEGSIRHLSWWTEDVADDDAEYELHITPAAVGGLIRGTGYVVTPLEVATAYDPDADE